MPSIKQIVTQLLKRILVVSIWFTAVIMVVTTFIILSEYKVSSFVITIYAVVSVISLIALQFWLYKKILNADIIKDIKTTVRLIKAKLQSSSISHRLEEIENELKSEINNESLDSKNTE